MGFRLPDSLESNQNRSRRTEDRCTDVHDEVIRLTGWSVCSNDRLHGYWNKWL